MTFKNLLANLGERALILDGGMGTQLVARGIEPGAASNLAHPDAVLAVQRAYREAGADVILTNTFGANPPALERSGETDQLERIVAAACRIGREALGSGGYLAGDIGPTGEFLEPAGNLTEPQMFEAYLRAVLALADGGVDLFVIETMSDGQELEIAVRACRSIAPKLTVIAGMSFDPVRDGFRTNTGLTAADAAKTMAEAGADAIGANCGSVSPEQVARIVAIFRQNCDKPIMAEPNAGLPEMKGDRAVYRLGPEAFADAGLQIYRNGARLIGGCCGTSPEHIRCLRQALGRPRV